MRVAFLPYIDQSDNSYINSVVEAIEEADQSSSVIPMPRFRDIFKGKNDFDAVWFNWFENFPGSAKKLLKELIIKILLIQSLKRKKIKIYTVFHNKQPHDSKNPKVNLWFYKYLLKKSDKIIILSEESKKHIKALIGEEALTKTVKVSHPAYPIQKKEYDIKKPFTVLFFGLLRPYKNIENIFRLAKDNPKINFIIAGKPLDENYKNELIEASKGIKNIQLIPEFQNDDNIEKLIEESSVVILPYNIESSLNSGVLFYAFSKGINAIVPEIASVKEFENKELIYYYNYSSPEENHNKLSEALIKAYKEYRESPYIFIQKAKSLQKEVSKYSKEYLANQIKEAGLLK